MSDFRRYPRNSSNRLVYEYEPEEDELDGMNECEMERYFNVHLSRNDAHQMVDKMTSNIAIDINSDTDMTNSNINSSFIYSQIRGMLDRRGITVSEAEKILGISITPYTINKTGGSFTMVNNPIYRKVVDNLPLIVRTIYRTSPEKVEAEINQTISELNEVTALTEQVEEEIEALTKALEFTRYKERSTNDMLNKRLDQLLQELYLDYTKFPYFLRLLYDETSDFKEFIRMLSMEIVYFHTTWLNTRNDDIPGQMYFNIGFSQKIDDEETRRYVLSHSFIMAAVEYVILYYNYYDGYKHEAPHVCISISHRKSTPNTANIIYDVHEILDSINRVVDDYIANGTPACITLNMGYLPRFVNLAYMLGSHKQYLHSANTIKNFMFPIILGVGIENFTHGKEYLEIADTMRQKSTDNYNEIKRLEQELDCAITKRADLTKKRRSLHAHLRFLRSRITSFE